MVCIVLPMAVNFLSDPEVNEFVAAIENADIGFPSLFIIDTLARNFGGGDENSVQDMGRFVAVVDRLLVRFPGCAVMVVHHTGHNDKGRGRGSSALPAAADTIIGLSAGDEGRNITVACKKQKDAAEFPTMHVRRTVVQLDADRSSCVIETNNDWNVDSAVAEKPKPENVNRAKAIAALEKAGDAGLRHGQWMAASGLSKSNFGNALRGLLKDGQVHPDPVCGTTKHVYKLGPPPEPSS